jgi:hypothetical protein
MLILQQIVFLKEKSNELDALKKFMATVEEECGRNIIILQLSIREAFEMFVGFCKKEGV